MAKISLRNLLLFLAVIGPGIITANVDNDAGGIATYSLAGAHFGYSLLWVLIPITIMLVVVQEICARMGAATGKGLADLIRENFGIKITFYVMLALVFVNITNTISEFAGIAASGEIFGVSRYIAVPLAALAVWWIVVKGSYKSVEKIFLFACLFYVSYLISGVMAHPQWGDVVKNTLVPTFNFSSAYLIMLIGMIGTTIAPWMQFYLQSSIVEKNIKREDYKYSKWDVIVGCIIAAVVAFFIVIATASTIFKSGGNIVDAADAAVALIPLAGRFAGLLFAFGLLNASVFAASILPLSTAYSVSEAFGWENGVNRKFSEAKRFYILYTAIIVIGAAVIMIPNLSLVFLMYISQVLNGVLLPVILILMLYLANKKPLMGNMKNSKTINIISWASVVFLVIVNIFMITSLFIK
jgi:NRAMP (natural resistance-associated macrophage protein)-like metal ion transporter